MTNIINWLQGVNKMLHKHGIAGFQSRDYDDARNSDGGQGVKSAMDEMEESLTTKENDHKKNLTYVGGDPYFMKRSDFSTELRFSCHRGCRYQQLPHLTDQL